jgi:hypothetical protein
MGRMGQRGTMRAVPIFTFDARIMAFLSGMIGK